MALSDDVTTIVLETKNADTIAINKTVDENEPRNGL